MKPKKDKTLDVLETIKIRRSIRKYKPEAIPDEKLRKIFEAARLAPSAGNRQPWRFVVVQDADRKRALAKVANNHMFLADAAAIVVAVGVPEISEKWHDKDVMIAGEHMVLAAAALGYGTCWIGAFNEQKVKEILGVPDEIRVVELMPVGFL